MNTEQTVPTDVTGLDDADFECGIRPLLEILASDPSPQPARRMRAVLLDRALTLLRTGSRSEIDDEGYALERFLASEHGKSLRAQGAQGREVYGGLSAIARLLTAAADRADAPAADSILRNHRGRGREVLEALADRGAAMPRAALRALLGMSESHLSHVLRELEEADLIVRYRQGKEVMVDLGFTGREVVDRSVLPGWIQRLVKRLHEVAEGDRHVEEPAALVTEFLEHGAPSRVAAQRLVEGIRSVTYAVFSGSRIRSHEQGMGDLGPGDADRENRSNILRFETGKAAKEIAAERKAAQRDTNLSPRLGDIFLFSEFADYPVEWAVIDRDLENAQRYLVVAVDDYPQVGSCDVGHLFGEAGVVANIRCDVSRWLDASILKERLRTGILPQKILERACRKREEIEAGTLVASISEEEVDGDPEYRRWKDCGLQRSLASLPNAA